MLHNRLLPVFSSFIFLSFLATPGLAQEFIQDASSTAGLSGIDFGSAEWGDYDSDGDLDIMLTGRDVQGSPSAFIYENEDGVFSDINASIPGVSSSSAAWGDYDNDGDLDIIMTGKNASNQLVTRIFSNEQVGSTITFTPFGQDLAGLQAGSVEWGDYDNDGDLDVLLTGNNRSNQTVSFIYRNDMDAQTGERVFVDIHASIGAVFLGNATWGDYDNDGDLDILMTGRSFSDGIFTDVYKNNDGVFSKLNTQLMGLMLSQTSWGDYDNDGDLDILVSGTNIDGERQSLIYKNENGLFSDIGALLQGAESGAAEWGDCDNDGDLDVLLTGLSPDGTPFSTLYENNNGEFSPGEEVDGVRDGSAAWGDYDNDGDLDLLISGKGDDQGQRELLLYRNNTNNQNLPPTSPDGLRSSFKDGTFFFEWNPAVDNETPSTGLSYNVRVGTVDLNSVLVGPMALAEGYRILPAAGNAQHNTFFSLNVDLTTVAPNSFLVWNVQAVDRSFVGSPFSDAGFLYLAGQELEVADVPEDQGGRVRLSWDASHLDVPGSPMAYYSVWHRLLPEPDNIGSASLITPADITAEFNGAAIRKIVEKEGDVTYWEWEGNVAASNSDAYSFTTDTGSNRVSTEDGIHHYLVVAHTQQPSVYFDGQASSGFSLDNLAPSAPVGITGIKDGAEISISWDANQEPDFNQYLVFRGDFPEFEVASLEPLAATTSPSFIDAGSFPAGTFFYKVVAEDIHGNVSEASEAISVVVTTSTEEDSAVPGAFALHQNYPNPFNPNTLIQFDLPQAGEARLTIYNAYGQQIEVLVDGIQAAGQHAVSWQPDGLSSGTYFYRLETQDFVASKRMIFIK